MKTKTAFIGLLISVLITFIAVGQTYIEYLTTIKDSPITWLKNLDYSSAIENDDISIRDFKFDDKSNQVKFSYFNYNLLAWQPTTFENGELVYVPGSPNASVCIFIYSKKNDRWIGGPITTIQLGIEFADVNGIYHQSNGWPKITGKIKSTTPLAMCLLKDDGTERSPIIFNF